MIIWPASFPRSGNSFARTAVQSLHRTFPWFYRKGQVGVWRTEMPEDLRELCWERKSH